MYLLLRYTSSTIRFELPIEAGDHPGWMKFPYLSLELAGEEPTEQQKRFLTDDPRVLIWSLHETEPDNSVAGD